MWFFEKLAQKPLCKLYQLSDAIFWVISHATIFPFHRNVRNHLRLCFPEYDNAKIAEIANLHYRCLCDNIAETIAASNFSDKEMKGSMIYKNIEVIDALFKQNRFIICYGAHMVGFELFSGFPLWRNQFGLLTYYNANSNNKVVDRWVRKRRERFGAVCIPTHHPLRQIIKTQQEMEKGNSVKQGYIIGSLADFTPKDSSAKGRVSFFNSNVNVLIGTERIGNMLNAAFVYAHITRPARGKYEVEFIPLDVADNSGQFPYTQAFYNELEKNIRQQPELWNMWGMSEWYK